MRATLFQVKSLLFLFCLSMFSISLQAQGDVLVEADQMPYFAGCETENPDTEDKRKCSNKNIVRFISNQLIYPALAKEAGIEGTVYVSFIIDEQGKVILPNIIRDIGGGCGEAALDILRNMPSWEPAFHQGEVVKVKLNLPIIFSLKNEVAIDKAQSYEINWGSLATQKVTADQLQDQLEKTLHVRDQFGDDKPIVELIFAFEKRRSYLEESSAGKISEDLKRIVNKCKKGGLFSITAVVQVKGELIFVKRAFEVI